MPIRHRIDNKKLVKFGGPEKDRFKGDEQMWLTKASHNCHCVVIFSLNKKEGVRFLSIFE